MSKNWSTDAFWLMVFITSSTIGVWGDPETVQGLLYKRDSPPKFDGQQLIGQQQFKMPENEGYAETDAFQKPENFAKVQEHGEFFHQFNKKFRKNPYF